ncbi:Serine/threonine-protein kinase pim-3 [Labeo rohita]|uniref:non-specific serine/threonine protein kinase n=1 Tax=Labeo rohita TaxID=84645 RepID=A0ABQ8MB88_LABRO|nr:Serine/threonine-protein kinase pim-3 [Labeo rohita]
MESTHSVYNVTKARPNWPNRDSIAIKSREVDDGDPLVDSSPEEPITSHSSDDWSDNVILGDLSEWRADVLHALNGVMSKFKDDSLQTPAHVASDLSVDVPQVPVHAAVECGVNDFPKNTVCVTPDCSVDVPETICPTTDCTVDVPKTAVCVTSDCSVDVPKTVYPTTDSNVDVRKTAVCVTPDCSVDVPKTVCPTSDCTVDVPKTTVCVAPDCSVDVPETVCPTSDCTDDVPKTTVCVAPDCSVDVPKTVDPTTDYSVDVRKTTVCVTPDCSVDVPKTVCPTTDCTVDVPKTTVCVAPDCSVDVPETVCVDFSQAAVYATSDSEDVAPPAEFYVEPDSEDVVPPAEFYAESDSQDEAPLVEFYAEPKSIDEAPPVFHAEPESEDEAPPSKFYSELGSADDAPPAVFCAEPGRNAAVPQAPVCETEDTSVSPQSNQLQNNNLKIIEINSESYEIGTQLGQGGFGTVYAATRLKDGLQVAVKIASRRDTKSIRIDGYPKPVPLEVALLIQATQGTRVPEIIQLLDWEDLRDHYRMVLERPIPCQSLYDFIRSYNGTIEEDLARIIMRQAVTAAQTCCRHGVLHRDIKPENFLITLDKLELKLIDFGCGEILTNKAYRLYAGTHNRVQSTRVYHDRDVPRGASNSVVTRVLLFIILCKKFPQRQDLWNINENIWTKKGLSEECCNFICCCMQLDPKKRIELEKLSLHKWLKITDTESDKTAVIDVHSSIYEVGIQLSARFGTVYAATRLSDDVQVAVKFVSKKNKKLLNIACYPKPVPLELALLARANEGPRVPEIIQLLDWQEESEHYVMILERVVPSEDLDWFVLSQMTEIQENMAWVIMRQVTTAAQMCCRRGVLHRDLTPESFQINPDTLELKLINFGCGEILTDAAYTSFTGAEQYCPPEYLITGEYHGKPATVWSLGIFLFTRRTGPPTKPGFSQGFFLHLSPMEFWFLAAVASGLLMRNSWHSLFSCRRLSKALQYCGRPFWIEGELPVFVVRPHALN